MEWAGAICKALEAQGHWSDYIDPCSGLPVRMQESVSIGLDLGREVSLKGPVCEACSHWVDPLGLPMSLLVFGQQYGFELVCMPAQSNVARPY